MVVFQVDYGTKAKEVGPHGFVRLVDAMGRDESIVQAARVSYGSGLKTPEQDMKLINYLVKNDHTSPLEMVEFKFHIKCPIYVWRQWIRHRTANVNEISGRYTELKDEFDLTPIDGWRLQSTSNKQGSEGTVSQFVGELLSQEEEKLVGQIYEFYRQCIASGVAKEQARKILPLSIYTEAYWKIDLHNLLHFLKLRTDSHAQLEIREFADAILEIIEEIVPWTVAAWRERHGIPAK